MAVDSNGLSVILIFAIALVQDFRCPRGLLHLVDPILDALGLPRESFCNSACPGWTPTHGVEPQRNLLVLCAVDEIVDEHEIVREYDYLPLGSLIHEALSDLSSPAMVQR